MQLVGDDAWSLLRLWTGGGNLGGMQKILISLCYWSIIQLDKLEFIAKQLHNCVYIDTSNRKERFIMNKNYNSVINETVKLEGYDLL